MFRPIIALFRPKFHPKNINFYPSSLTKNTGILGPVHRFEIKKNLEVFPIRPFTKCTVRNAAGDQNQGTLTQVSARKNSKFGKIHVFGAAGGLLTAVGLFSMWRNRKKKNRNFLSNITKNADLTRDLASAYEEAAKRSRCVLKEFQRLGPRFDLLHMVIVLTPAINNYKVLDKDPNCHIYDQVLCLIAKTRESYREIDRDLSDLLIQVQEFLLEVKALQKKACEWSLAEGVAILKAEEAAKMEQQAVNLLTRGRRAIALSNKVAENTNQLSTLIEKTMPEVSGIRDGCREKMF